MSKLIDAEKLIEKVEAECHEQGKILDADDCIMLINDAPDENAWIKIENELPKTNMFGLSRNCNVLVEYRNGYREITVGAYCKNDDSWILQSCCKEKVIAWLPLPETRT